MKYIYFVAKQLLRAPILAVFHIAAMMFCGWNIYISGREKGVIIDVNLVLSFKLVSILTPNVFSFVDDALNAKVLQMLYHKRYMLNLRHL